MKTYKLIKDYPLAGKKKGDTIRVPKLSFALKPFVDTSDEVEEDNVEVPNEKWKNEDIVGWLAQHNVEAKGTKEELLKEVKKVLKSK